MREASIAFWVIVFWRSLAYLKFMRLNVLPKPEKIRGIEGLRTDMIGREKEFAE